MRPPAPPSEITENHERWLWAALWQARDTYCKISKQPTGNFIKINSIFLEALAKEEVEAKAAEV